MSRLLARGRRVSTVELAERFGVSPMTVRRDLGALAEAGVAVRCYGGAVPAQRITFEFAFDERRRRRLAQKGRIGAEAATRVQPEQVVFIDTGTTTLELARALVRRGVACTVVTGSLVIASELWGSERVELTLVGGRVRRGSPDLVGPGTEVMLDRLTADVAFLGSDGIDPARGSFAADVEAARVAEHMVANARHVVVLADSSKLGLPGAARYARLEQIAELITDRDADRALVGQLRKRGVRVTLV